MRGMWSTWDRIGDSVKVESQKVMRSNIMF